MSEIAHHVMRRAIYATQQHIATTGSPSDNPSGEPDIKQIAGWGIALLWVTFLLYMVMVSAVDYTYGDVVATLTMIETPTATAFKTTSIDDDEEESIEVDAPLLSEDQKSEKQKLKTLEQNLFLVKQPPITRKLRTAVKHIVSVGGKFARFRGLHIAVLYSLLHGIIVNTFSSHYPPIRSSVSILATLVLCRYQMLWNHIVISNPSAKSWYHRLPSYATCKAILLPTFVYALASQAAIYIPLGLGIVVSEQFRQAEQFGDSAETVRKMAVAEMAGVILVGISCFIAMIPAKVTLARVQASLLPEDEATIVPFDRTFGGKVQPRVLGGNGAVSMLDAWKTFDKASRWRLIKLYFKVFAIQIFAFVAFSLTIVGELRLIMGDDFEKMIKAAKEQLKGQN